MSERRMFAKTIIDSDAFLEMPSSTQCLYFHLGMRADDDGVINNPRSIMRICGAKEDDMNVLITKKFVIPLADQIIVIKHWKINNYIQSDRYKPSKYKELVDSLELDENNAYKLPLYPKCIQNVSKMDTQVSIGKDSIDKYNIYTCSNESADSASLSVLFDSFWSAYPRKIGKDKCINWFKQHKPNNTLVQQMIDSINKWKQSDQWSKDNGKYIPYPYTWLNRGGWNDELEQTENKPTRKGWDEL